MFADFASGFGVAIADLVFLVAVATLAGIVRGFSGFGSALIYIPLAATVLPPVWVLITLTVMDLVGPLPNLPRAVREGRPRQVAAIGAVAGVTLLAGLWALDRIGDAGFRWVVSGLCLVTVALMATGWRWSGRITPAIILGSGGMSGFLGGLSGLAGPPVILTYMSASLPAATIRANVLMYLVLWDAMLISMLAVQGRLTAAPLLLGAVLILPYLGANVAGAWVFRTGAERMYRAAAYIIITGAAVMALPVWSL
ncbi:TSUP family transporter [Jannaschia sp. 2305UL9-9]|uniref:TSUP family transporter n=1 Tax=Jannaschia sp. 2305UL9-9 TaxID=3121638 RepID=UPI003527BAFD